MTSRAPTVTGWALALLVSSVPVVLALLPPFTGEALRQWIMVLFSSVCHQLPERSPHIQGIQLAVCDRCLGIYGALAVSSFSYVALRRWDRVIDGSARFLIPIAVVIPGVDWMAGLLGLWTGTPGTRAATGAVFGLAAGYFFSRALVRLVEERAAGRQPASSSERGWAERTRPHEASATEQHGSRPAEGSRTAG